MTETTSLVPEKIAQRIHLVRGQKIMLDTDLAALYKVETRTLVQAVKRNLRRFPQDFMFQLTDEEWGALRSQFVTSKGRGGRRYAPLAAKLDALERKVGSHDQAIAGLIDAIRQLMAPPIQSKRPIGFIQPKGKPAK